MFKTHIITLFPDLFPGPLGASVLGRGLDEKRWSLETVPLRSFGAGRHASVDDTPAGGGPGMVLRADILARAIDSISPPADPRPRLLMSPRGTPLDQEMAQKLAREPGLVIACGRFEGVDQRVIEARNLREISIGDYVMTGGEVAAMALLESVVRLLPGILGESSSTVEESHAGGLLEYPHYTRPREFEGRNIPDILLSGDHGKIANWRQEQSRQLTRTRRPDLWSRFKREKG